jgi:cation diffusion facilitator family transporter
MATSMRVRPAAADAHEGEQGTKRVILAALVANLLIAIAKLVAGFMSGSSAMLAESAHSIADTINQVFLLLSLRLSRAEPDEDHPYGHGKDRFFWSFLAAVFIFFAGALFSLYNGIHAVLDPAETHESFRLNYIVLGIAFTFEAIALVISVREFRHAARAEGHGFREHWRVSRNTSMKVPLYEDVAALVGVLIAAGGLWLVQSTGNGMFDGLASVGVGLVLLYVALQLGIESRALLIGEAVAPEERRELRAVIEAFPEVTRVLRLLTMHLGPNDVLVNAEVHLANGLDTDRIEILLEDITQALRRDNPKVTQTFIELRSPDQPVM